MTEKENPNLMMELVDRYPANTPTWKLRYDYYIEVAKSAEKAGNKYKAKRYRAKAEAIKK